LKADRLFLYSLFPYPNPLPGGEGIATPSHFGLIVSHVFYWTRGDAKNYQFPFPVFQRRGQGMGKRDAA